MFYDTSNQTKGGQYKMIKTVLRAHSFKYRRILADGENVEDVQTDKHIPYKQNELQQAKSTILRSLSYKKKIDKYSENR
ncbi:hypothetical protein bcere0025_51520 [Bacillus cereus F65185]|nr:hypothetical protein bcere0025_51520 [Bacillus cereus F65185]